MGFHQGNISNGNQTEELHSNSLAKWMSTHAISVLKINSIICLIPPVENIRHCPSINSILTSFPLEIAYQQIVQSFCHCTYILNICVSVASYDTIMVLTSYNLSLHYSIANNKR
jgi:hypothetical protein